MAPSHKLLRARALFRDELMTRVISGSRELATAIATLNERAYAVSRRGRTKNSLFIGNAGKPWTPL